MRHRHALKHLMKLRDFARKRLERTDLPIALTHWIRADIGALEIAIAVLEERLASEERDAAETSESKP